MNEQENIGTSSASDCGSLTTSDQSAEVVAHTPGPWIADEDHGNAITIRHDPKDACATGDEIASVFNENSSDVTDQMRADARLIAAAPELLAALRNYVGQYGLNATQMARDAITKAEGRSP